MKCFHTTAGRLQGACKGLRSCGQVASVPGRSRHTTGAEDGCKRHQHSRRQRSFPRERRSQSISLSGTPPPDNRREAEEPRLRASVWGRTRPLLRSSQSSKRHTAGPRARGRLREGLTESQEARGVRDASREKATRPIASTRRCRRRFTACEHFAIAGIKALKAQSHAQAMMPHSHGFGKEIGGSGFVTDEADSTQTARRQQGDSKEETARESETR